MKTVTVLILALLLPTASFAGRHPTPDEVADQIAADREAYRNRLEAENRWSEYQANEQQQIENQREIIEKLDKQNQLLQDQDMYIQRQRWKDFDKEFED